MTIPQSTKKVDAGRVKGALAVPNVIEIAIKQTGANGKQANFACYGAYASAPPSLASLATALWNAISGAWSTNLAPQMAPAAEITSVWIRDMSNVNNPIVVGTGPAIPGTGTGNPLPPETAIVITENINARGRGLKGRMYLGGFVDSAGGANGIISAGGQAAVQGFATALFNAITTNSLTPCVPQVARNQYIGFTGTVHAARTPTHVTCSQYVLRNNEFDTQRRRGVNG